MTLDECRIWLSLHVGWTKNALGGWDGPINSSEDCLDIPIGDAIDDAIRFLPQGSNIYKDGLFLNCRWDNNVISVVQTGDNTLDHFNLAVEFRKTLYSRLMEYLINHPDKLHSVTFKLKVPNDTNDGEMILPQRTYLHCIRCYGLQFWEWVVN